MRAPYPTRRQPRTAAASEPRTVPIFIAETLSSRTGWLSDFGAPQTKRPRDASSMTGATSKLFQARSANASAPQSCGKLPWRRRCHAKPSRNEYLSRSRCLRPIHSATSTATGSAGRLTIQALCQARPHRSRTCCSTTAYSDCPQKSRRRKGRLLR